MLYVKLTRSNGDPIYINLDTSRIICSDEEGTYVEWNDECSVFGIKETPEEILALAAKS